MLRVSGLAAWRERLERVQAAAAMAAALAEQSAVVAEAVRTGLSDMPGEGGHERPWARTGALRESVGVMLDGLCAVVGSSDPAAAPQEMGTLHDPPRPFLAPVGAAMGETVATAVGAAVAAAIRGTPAHTPETPPGGAIVP